MPPWPNCLLLAGPLLVFNAVFGTRLPEGLYHDEGVPSAIGLPESALRVVVFVAPLWLPLRLERRGPLVVFSLGAVLYVLSWVPALADLELARRMPVYLLPHITPVVWLLALAWMGRSWLFATASLVFVGLHTSHGVLAHRQLHPW